MLEEERGTEGRGTESSEDKLRVQKIKAKLKIESHAEKEKNKERKGTQIDSDVNIGHGQDFYNTATTYTLKLNGKEVKPCECCDFIDFKENSSTKKTDMTISTNGKINMNGAQALVLTRDVVVPPEEEDGEATTETRELGVVAAKDTGITLFSNDMSITGSKIEISAMSRLTVNCWGGGTINGSVTIGSGSLTINGGGMTINGGSLTVDGVSITGTQLQRLINLLPAT
jgi:hypothetical protein